MSSNLTSCSTDRLALFLEGQLSPPDESSVIEHLDTCSQCQSWLETRAGDEDWWRDAHDALSGIGVPELGSEGEETQDIAVASAAAMADALRLLGPSEDPGMLGRLGPYEITGIIGRGGTGIVFKAWERRLSRYVAVKVLAPHFVHSAAARQRFSREAKAAAAVVHEHLVPIYAVDDYQGLPYMVMRYIPGESLQRRLNDQGPLEVCEVIRIALQTARGLAAAHAQGLIHRDIKPANLLLERGVERVLVTDFGLARAADDASLTCSGVIAGTPQYMAPEQARGETLDARADLFSLGSMMYAMCAGHPPFRAETSLGVLHRICETRPRPLRQVQAEIPQWLAEFIDRLMAKEPENRFATAEEVADFLEEELAHLQNPLAVPEPERSWSRIHTETRRWSRNIIALAIACVAVLAIGIGTMMTLPLASPPTAPEEAAQVQAAGGGAETINDHGAAEVRAVQGMVRAVEQRWSQPTAETPDAWKEEARALRHALDRVEAQAGLADF